MTMQQEKNIHNGTSKLIFQNAPIHVWWTKGLFGYLQVICHVVTYVTAIEIIAIEVLQLVLLYLAWKLQVVTRVAKNFKYNFFYFLKGLRNSSFINNTRISYALFSVTAITTSMEVVTL